MLHPVGSVVRDDLKTAVGVNVSPDGNHLYAAGYNAPAVTMFERDQTTGLLNNVQTLNERTNFDGVIAVSVSPNGNYVATAAFRLNAVTLLRRDAESGRLTVLDSARQGVNSVSGLSFVVDLAFSPDSKFIYAIADTSAALSVFRVSDQEKLELAQTLIGPESCFSGARGIAISPDGRSIYVTSCRADTLVALDRDSTSGVATIRQIMRGGTNGVASLAGAFSVACSPDGQHVYVSSGRFRGANAISAFKRKEDGTLELMQEVTNGQSNLSGFLGGNSLLVTPDGTDVYAVATVSGTIACLDRSITTGALTAMQTVVNGIDGAGPLGFVSGIGTSPDGKFVYIAAERHGAISIFRR